MLGQFTFQYGYSKTGAVKYDYMPIFTFTFQYGYSKTVG